MALTKQGPLPPDMGPQCAQTLPPPHMFILVHFEACARFTSYCIAFLFSNFFPNPGIFWQSFINETVDNYQFGGPIIHSKNLFSKTTTMHDSICRAHSLIAKVPIMVIFKSRPTKIFYWEVGFFLAGWRGRRSPRWACTSPHWYYSTQIWRQRNPTSPSTTQPCLGYATLPVTDPGGR